MSLCKSTQSDCWKIPLNALVSSTNRNVSVPILVTLGRSFYVQVQIPKDPALDLGPKTNTINTTTMPNPNNNTAKTKQHCQKQTTSIQQQCQTQTTTMPKQNNNAKNKQHQYNNNVKTKQQQCQKQTTSIHQQCKNQTTTMSKPSPIQQPACTHPVPLPRHYH